MSKANLLKGILIAIGIIIIVYVLDFLFFLFFTQKQEDPLPILENNLKNNCLTFYNDPKSETESVIKLPIDCKLNIGNNFTDWKFSVSKGQDSIKILTGNNKFVQKIPIGDYLFRTAEKPLIFYSNNFNVAYDINFDGYKDIRVLNTRGASNELFDYWIFNPNSKIFEKDSVLANVPNPTFSQDKKTISAFVLTGVGSGTVQIYQFTDGKYVKNIEAPLYPETADEQTYTNYQYGFLLKYPDYFEKIITSPQVNNYIIHGKGTNLLQSPATGSGLAMFVIYFPKSTQLFIQEVRDAEKEIPNASLQNLKPINVDGEQAYAFTSGFSNMGIVCVTNEAIIPSGDGTINIIFSKCAHDSGEDNFNLEFTNVEKRSFSQMLLDFKFTK